MRAKKVTKKQTLRDAANEFIAIKKARKLRERTISDYEKYFDKFISQSQNVMDVNVLRLEILDYFAKIEVTSPAVYNHPYQYLHALFEWCAKQEYLPYNPFDKLELKKIKDEGNIMPAEIKEIQILLDSLNKDDYTELRDYTIILLMLDTGIRTSELLSIKESDYDSVKQSIFIRQDVAKTSRSRTLYLSNMTNASIKRFLKVKPTEWENWLFPTRDGLQLQSNNLGRNFRKYCKRAEVKFTPYQLRHSFATFYLQNGGDLFTLQKQMGHSDLQMTKRYTEVSEELVCSSHSSFTPIGMLQSNTRKAKIR